MSGETRIRLDEALVVRGLAPSRARARDAVIRGTVSVDGRTEAKPARLVGTAQAITIDDPAARYVSRSALKLIAALDAFGFDPNGLTALDLGASTGGFSQVLLERGAARVVAIDVGHGEMDAALAADPRVTLLEGLNARDFARSQLGGRAIGAVVADLSFISLRLALPPALALAEPSAWGVFLAKPQFEVGRKALGKGGIVRDAQVAEKAVNDLALWLESDRGPSHSEGEVERVVRRRNPTPNPSPQGGGAWRVIGILPSPIAGGSGNREFLIGARRG